MPNPLIVVEVSAPETEWREHGAKLQGYFALPSLHHYLIIDPDRPLLIHHKRGTGDAIETRIASGPSLRLDPPGLELDLTEILEG